MLYFEAITNNLSCFSFDNVLFGTLSNCQTKGGYILSFLLLSIELNQPLQKKCFTLSPVTFDAFLREISLRTSYLYV